MYYWHKMRAPHAHLVILMRNSMREITFDRVIYYCMMTMTSHMTSKNLVINNDWLGWLNNGTTSTEYIIINNNMKT